MALDNWLADNYTAIVADENRGITYKSLADEADAKNAPELAAWARARAAESGKDVTPKAATPRAEKAERTRNK